MDPEIFGQWAGVAAVVIAAGAAIWRMTTKAGRYLGERLFCEQKGLVTVTVRKHWALVDGLSEFIDEQKRREHLRDAADKKRDEILQELRELQKTRPCMNGQPKG